MGVVDAGKEDTVNIVCRRCGHTFFAENDKLPNRDLCRRCRLVVDVPEDDRKPWELPQDIGEG